MMLGVSILALLQKIGPKLLCLQLPNSDSLMELIVWRLIIDGTTNNPKIQSYRGTADGEFDVESAGNYKLTAKIYITGTVPASIRFSGTFAGTWTAFNFPLSGLTPNTWNDVEVTKPIGVTSNAWFSIQFLTLPPSGTGTVYIDDIKFSQEVLSANDIKAFEYKVFTNPAIDLVNVNTPSGSSLTLYNTIGAKITSFENISKKHSFSTKNLKSGLYILKIKSEGKTATKKLLIE